MAIDPHLTESLAICYGAEDFFGPFELIWGLNTHYPSESLEEKRTAADAALRRLTQAGLLELHACDTGDPYVAPISGERALAAFAEPTFWLTPAESQRAPFYWFASTPAGEQALDDGQFKSL